MKMNASTRDDLEDYHLSQKLFSYGRMKGVLRYKTFFCSDKYIEGIKQICRDMAIEQEHLRCRPVLEPILTLMTWFERKDLKIYRTLPFLVLWGVWLAHNLVIFQKKINPTFQTTTQVCSLFQLYQTLINPKTIRQVGHVTIYL